MSACSRATATRNKQTQPKRKERRFAKKRLFLMIAGPAETGFALWFTCADRRFVSSLPPESHIVGRLAGFASAGPASRPARSGKGSGMSAPPRQFSAQDIPFAVPGRFSSPGVRGFPQVCPAGGRPAGRRGRKTPASQGHSRKKKPPSPASQGHSSWKTISPAKNICQASRQWGRIRTELIRQSKAAEAGNR